MSRFRELSRARKLWALLFVVLWVLVGRLVVAPHASLPEAPCGADGCATWDVGADR